MLRKKSIIHRHGGFSLVEAMLSVSLFALLVTALAGVWIYGEEASRLSGNRIRASFVAEEGIEAIRSMRDGNFAALTPGTYGLQRTTTWSFLGASDTTDAFTRSVSIGSSAFHARMATSTVAWQQGPGRTGSLEVVTLLTNWLRSWQDPLLAGSFNIAGTEDGWRIAYQGDYAYLVRSAGTPDFAVINISNPSAPVLVGSLTLAGSPFDIAVNGNYAFIASSVNTQELQVIDIGNPSLPALVGSFNASGTDDGTSISLSGTRVYLTRTGAPNFVIIDVTSPTVPTLLGSMNLTGTPRGTIQLGTYTYVASENDAQEIQIVNVATPSTPLLSGSFNMSGTVNASTIAGFGTILIFGREGLSEVAALSVSNPIVPTLLDSITFPGGAVHDITLGYENSFIFAATSHGTGELKVIDALDLGSLALVGEENTSATLFGIAYDPSRDRAYAAGGANTQEVIVFTPQP